MILVTGATGLVGSHLLYELLKNEEKVKALKRQSSDTGHVLKTFGYYTDEHEKLYSRIEWVEGDVSDKGSLETAFKDVNRVYHTAAVISMDSADNTEMMKINVEGTANIVNLCLEKKISKLCFVSSVAAIGNRTPPVFVDESVLWKAGKKKITYGSTKFNAEIEVWRGMAEGLEAVIVNPSIIIGPGVWGKGSLAMFDKIAKGLKFYTHGVTGYIDVRDVVKAMILLMESDEKGERFILNSENLSFREIFGMIALALNKPAPNIYANRFMTGFVWRLDWLKNMFTGGTHLITKETVAIAHRKTLFSNEKVRKVLGIDFIPMRKSIEDTARRSRKRRRKR
ncbi:MAG: NAD-dependent epimerase/dehydratase family protein [Bacteroidales bacterium]|nr:NAD-dependent epimerase/dehydratase family protein [Bacteroidales bacterium]